jgi:hypothetical protein
MVQEVKANKKQALELAELASDWLQHLKALLDAPNVKGDVEIFKTLQKDIDDMTV